MMFLSVYELRKTLLAVRAEAAKSNSDFLVPARNSANNIPALTNCQKALFFLILKCHPYVKKMKLFGNNLKAKVKTGPKNFITGDFNKETSMIFK